MRLPDTLATCTRLLGATAALAIAGCTAIAPINQPIAQVDPANGYRVVNLLKREQRSNNPQAMVLLAFSGGGTRAAALSYGVLEELRRTPIAIGGRVDQTHPFLDEVDMVTGVSGGSFTALAYALYGERLFTEFEPRFLKRDVQGELKEVGFSELRHIVVIVVNSRSDPSTDWDRNSTPPGFVTQLLQSSSLPIDHFSSDSVELLKDIAQRWINRRRLEIAEKRIEGMMKAQAEAAVPAISFAAIDVSFDAIADPAERRYFMDLPTSFVLPADAVDKLRAVGGRLLRESRGFQSLLKQIAEGKAAQP